MLNSHLVWIICIGVDCLDGVCPRIGGIRLGGRRNEICGGAEGLSILTCHLEP